MPTLTIQLPGLPPVDHILRDEMMTIGRMKGNTIALDDASVSVSHAKITRKGSDFFLKDLNSTNGTMLNGQSVNEARLKDGDQLKFGEVIALYHSEPDFVSTTPSPNPPVASAPQPAPPSPPVIASTTFVSKRLVSQAAQLSQAPAPASSPLTAPASRSRKKKQNWLIPAMGGVAVLAVIVLAVRFFFTNSDPAKTPGNPTSATSPAKNPTPNNSPGVVVKPSPVPPKNPSGNDNKTLADFKKALKSADVVERRRAAASLHGLGSGAKEAVPELRSALGDSDSEVRMWAALALINNKSYDKASIPILIQVLHHENSMLRQVSCLSLALIPYEEADKDAVVTALVDTANKDDDDEVRKAAISALKIIAPDSVTTGK